ncbi:DnaJ domain containing protein [Novymonas esmeraldas]|uniref:DnaJ domain containing protein n=1 Tax=Novymonas esmeraldas TaxID=1808958 RepID=A0AAW0EXB4_9TRYP
MDGGGSAVDAVAIAKRVLEADGQPFTILSLAHGMAPVTPETPVPEARRSYMRLAGVLHPDRLHASYERATEAFQCLVRAFETFADPKSRKQAAAAAAAAARAQASSVAAPSSASRTRAKRAPPAKATARTKAAPASSATSRTGAAPAAKRARKAKDDSGEDSEDGGQDLTEEDDSASEASAADERAWEAWAAADAEPEVSTNRTPIGKPRTTGVCQQAPAVGCPKCRSLWEPDARPQYSLFMGSWGKKVHCQLCLFQFGCATAVHGCPHCSTPFDYDVSMYDAVQTCTRCKKEFGFPYYPVSQHLIDQIALEEWRERVERQKASEREARARARRGDDGDAAAAAEEKMQLLVGTCIMEEQCPLCHKRVKSKHRAHVQECAAATPEARVAPTKPAAKATPATRRRVAAAPPKPRAKAATPAPTARGKRTAAPQRRKRRRSESESEEEEDSASDDDDEEDEISSESSFSDDDSD